MSNTACTPSRAALLTGTYANRIGMDGDFKRKKEYAVSLPFPGNHRGLNPSEITIAEMLKDDMQPDALENGISETNQNSCRLPKVLTPFWILTPMICRKKGNRLPIAVLTSHSPCFKTKPLPMSRMTMISTLAEVTDEDQIYRKIKQPFFVLFPLSCITRGLPG